MGFETPEQFEALKESGKLLFGQLPLLEIDGLNLTQAAAMVQYIARKHSLVGDSPQENVKCDMIFGATTDLAQASLASWDSLLLSQSNSGV